MNILTESRRDLLLKTGYGLGGIALNSLMAGTTSRTHAGGLSNPGLPEFPSQETV